MGVRPGRQLCAELCGLSEFALELLGKELGLPTDVEAVSDQFASSLHIMHGHHTLLTFCKFKRAHAHCIAPCLPMNCTMTADVYLHMHAQHSIHAHAKRDIHFNPIRCLDGLPASCMQYQFLFRSTR